MKSAIKYLHFADAATVDSSGKVSILGIFDVMFLATLPSKYPKFTVVGTIILKSLKIGRHTVELKFEDSKNQLLTLSQPIKIEFNVEKEQNEGGFNIILDVLGLEIKNYGEHKLNIYLDNEFIGARTFKAEERKIKK